MSKGIHLCPVCKVNQTVETYQFGYCSYKCRKQASTNPDNQDNQLDNHQQSLGMLVAQLQLQVNNLAERVQAMDKRMEGLSRVYEGFRNELDRRKDLQWKKAEDVAQKLLLKAFNNRGVSKDFQKMYELAQQYNNKCLESNKLNKCVMKVNRTGVVEKVMLAKAWIKYCLEQSDTFSKGFMTTLKNFYEALVSDDVECCAQIYNQIWIKIAKAKQ